MESPLSPEAGISWLRYCILICFGLEMDKKETATLLAAEYDVPLTFTQSVWETLEAAVPELFRRLYENPLHNGNLRPPMQLPNGPQLNGHIHRYVSRASVLGRLPD